MLLTGPYIKEVSSVIVRKILTMQYLPLVGMLLVTGSSRTLGVLVGVQAVISP
jgi:hypothetical protein